MYISKTVEKEVFKDFLIDGEYFDKTEATLQKHEKEVKKLSDLLLILLDREIALNGKVIWANFTNTSEYKKLQNLYIQVDEGDMIINGDYYFEKVVLSSGRERDLYIVRDKYGLNAPFPADSDPISLYDFSVIKFPDTLTDEEGKRLAGESRISAFHSTRGFLRKRLNIKYDEREMDRKEKFEYLKLLNLVYLYSNKLEYLGEKSINRNENDLLGTRSPYHDIIFPIKREIMKEISISRLREISQVVLLFREYEIKLEAYVLSELVSIFELALSTNIEYANHVLSDKSERLIKNLKYEYKDAVKGNKSQEPIFEKAYRKLILFPTENKFYLTEGFEFQPTEVTVAFLKNLNELKGKVGRKLPLKEVDDFVEAYAKEIAQLLTAKHEVNALRRDSAKEKYKALLQLSLEVKGQTTNEVCLEEIIAVIDIVRRFTFNTKSSEEKTNHKVQEPGYKGGSKEKSKSIRTIIDAIKKQYNDQNSILNTDNYRNARIIYDMIAEQSMENCGFHLSFEMKEVIRKIIYKTFLKKVEQYSGVVTFDKQCEFIRKTADEMRNNIFQYIYC
ncbi:hypothetical protein SPFL3102_00608 [Sporomusaceae bacterium FL31]|nr:hypothetical protein SPFL3101_01343 [Sporomusaceae bacterium FL31]GCE32811.1 hypothetical protein SPFL3102_00608 [Sporomusaceae bacterium]